MLGLTLGRIVTLESDQGSGHPAGFFRVHGFEGNTPLAGQELLWGGATGDSTLKSLPNYYGIGRSAFLFQQAGTVGERTYLSLLNFRWDFPTFPLNIMNSYSII